MTAFSPRYLMALWLLIGFAAPAAATPTLEQEQELRTSFVTPHTRWAKPSAGGTTRVLFFSDYENTQAREIVELMQRFEVQADAAYWTRGWGKLPRYQWHGGEEGIARIRWLLESGAHNVAEQWEQQGIEKGIEKRVVKNPKVLGHLFDFDHR